MTVEQARELTLISKEIEEARAAVGQVEQMIAKCKETGQYSLNGYATKYEKAIQEATRLTLFHYQLQLKSLEAKREALGKEISDSNYAKDGITLSSKMMDYFNCATVDVQHCRDGVIVIMTRKDDPTSPLPPIRESLINELITTALAAAQSGIGGGLDLLINRLYKAAKTRN